jgi:hypothetical protein
MIVAVIAMTVALGSAAAYALLPELPEPLQGTVGKVANAADNVVGHIVGPPDTDDPTPPDPDVSVPGSDELPLPGILGAQSAAAPARAPKPKGTKAPVAAPAAPEDTVTEAVQSALAEAGAPAPAPDPAPKQEPEKGELDGLFEEPLISVPNQTYGEGWNFCNNNNSDAIVNRDSDGNESHVDQEQNDGDMVTRVDGQESSGDGDEDACVKAG